MNNKFDPEVIYLDDNYQGETHKQRRCWYTCYTGPGWYWYNNSYTHMTGPYKTREQAEECLEKYYEPLIKHICLSN